MTEALPCPFCGDSPTVDTYIDEDLSTHNMVTYHRVSCACDVGPSFSIPDGYDCGSAIEVWNRRPK